MASTRRKAAAAGLAVVGIAGLSLAAAAQLDLTTDSLGAGSEIVASCDTDGIRVSFTRAWSAAAGADVTTAVNFADVAAACDGLSYELTVTGADGVVLQTVGGTAAEGSFSAAISQSSAAIEGIALVIFG